MQTKELTADNLTHKEDWEGNNIALECPVCGKVYIVSELIHGERKCPSCGKSRGSVKGGKKGGGKALISWDDSSPFVLGRTYSRKDIAGVLGGSDVHFLPTENGRVVCGCFTLKHNPEAPDIIIPGTGPQIEGEAQIFCTQTYAIPVFIKRQPNEWEFVGKFKVATHTTDESEIARHHCGSITPLNEVTRVMFLKREET